MKFLLVPLLAAAASAAVAPLHTAEERVDGSYMVVLKYGEDLHATVNSLRDLPFFSQSEGRIKRVYESVLHGFSATLDEQSLEHIRRMDNVKYVEEDGIARASGIQKSPPWGLDRIDQKSGTDGLYTYPGNGSNVTVYVLDTGIRHSHVEFGGRASYGWDYNISNRGEDCNGHGTHCAGTVGGSTYGVAKDVKLMSVRVLDCSGDGFYSDVIAGVEYVAKDCKGNCVASMSLGGSPSPSVDIAVANLVKGGIPTVVAAGNSNVSACNFSPAREPEAITVGATEIIDHRSYFSNYGSCVDIFAPGSCIRSAWHTSDTATNIMLGTSMACPHVAGAAALLLAGGVDPGSVPNKITSGATCGVIDDPGCGSPNLLLRVK